MVKNYPGLTKLFEAATNGENVSGYTHNFYNYPARFSPVFVREAIKTFTAPGDFVLDPFMGGGTSLVEAKSLGRNSIGFDISSLAYFLSKVKTTPITKAGNVKIKKWAESFVPNLKCIVDYSRPVQWAEDGYLKNTSEASVWPIRILMEKCIHEIEMSDFSKTQRSFLRASLLKTGQWALDSKKHIPTIADFREKLLKNICDMLVSIEEMNDFKDSVSICKNRPADKIAHDKIFQKIGAPKLVLTSPPYPGVHVMYHRWQIKGRRETPLPFWIADSEDGHGMAHYTMGDRHQKELRNYFDNILKAFSSIAKVCDKETVVVQVVGFSDVSWQVQKYLDMMDHAGFMEILSEQDRIWRSVPNRRWYAQVKSNDASKELVLFHQLKR